MTTDRLLRSARAIALLLTICAGAAGAARTAPAQDPPSGNVALAKELIALKGSTQMWDTVVPGVIEQVKGVFLQTNPMLSRELNEVAAQLRVEYAPRSAQLMDQTARLYAQAFTEQELKDALVFYKSPLGRKIASEEPKVLDDGFRRIQQWTNRFSEELMGKMRTEMKKKGYDL